MLECSANDNPRRRWAACGCHSGASSAILGVIGERLRGGDKAQLSPMCEYEEAIVPAPSKSQVRKAGSTLRAFTQGKVSEQECLAALEVIAEYRRTFADPLLKVNNGLRSFLATEGIEAEVSQRLKRMETIVEKVTHREKGLDLSRMGDIGGCRIVISDNNIPNIYRIRERIEYHWGVNWSRGNTDDEEL